MCNNLKQFSTALVNKYCQLLLCSLLATVIVYAQEKQVTLSPKIEKITNKLRKGNEIHFGNPIGYSGKKERRNKYYKLYLKLKKKATIEELELLTKDTSKFILVYAFDILWHKKYQNLKEIFLEHQNDTTYFWTASGCTGIINLVNRFILERLKLINKEGVNSFITQKEYDLYNDKLNKKDKIK